jgi:hypothetical protein
MISAQFKQKLYIHPFNRSKLIFFGPNLRKLVQSVDGVWDDDTSISISSAIRH